MHAMSRLPLRILSNARAWPSLASAGRTRGAGGSGTIPRPAASWRISCGVITSEGVTSCRAAVGAVGASVVRSEQATRPTADDTNNARLLHGRRFIELSLVIFTTRCGWGDGDRLDFEAALEGHAEKRAVFRHRARR